MNGPQHYAKAEGLAENAWRRISGQDHADYLHAPDVRDRLLATAQVHATLALAAAVVEGRAIGPLESWGGHHIELLDASPWREVTS